MSAPPPRLAAVLARPRLHIGDSIAIGPGKIDLLRRVDETRSIAAAARSLGLPYKRAWLLINSLNQGFGRPLVETATGGKGGGGAMLTPLGRELVQRYEALETHLNASAGGDLQALRDLAN